MQAANVRAGKLLQVKNYVRDDNISSQLDGATTILTISNPYVPGSIHLELNGVGLVKGVGEDYIEKTSTTVEVFIAPESTEKLVASYIKL